jgi:LysM repeat protein
MRRRWITVIFLLGLIGVVVSACTQDAGIETALTTGASEGTVELSPSDTPAPSATITNSPTPSSTPTPTMTPVYYEVQLGDDMYSIGWLFDVSPQAIMTANPSVDPRAMSVGTSLLIPITPTPVPTTTATSESEPTATLTPSATPDPSDLGEPDCYPDSLGGLWCFVMVDGAETGALENVSAVITLTAGEQTREEIATMPLNLLPEGESLPLIAYFEPPVLEGFTASAKMDFFLPVMPDDARYLEAEITEKEVMFNNSALVATVSGAVHIPDDGPDAAYVWIVAAAFDADGRIVAVRRWDSMEMLTAGADRPFELTLYSLSGAIDRVDLVVEARAVDEQTDNE